MLLKINSIIWIITTVLITYVGFYYTFTLGFPQLKIISMIKSLINKKSRKENRKILNLTLAGKIGVGSISGIALCILKGGVGSIFWLWVSSILLACLSYVETKLGIKYKIKKNNMTVGGPASYLEHGLNKKRLAKFYSILIILTYLIAFISIQTNTIIISLENTFSIKKIFIAIFLLVIILFAISKGINTISKVTDVLVPLMGVIYILLGFLIIVKDWNNTLNVFSLIIKSAFEKNTMKKSLLMSIVIGIERGIFSTEVGTGTTAMISSLSNDKNDNLCKIQILGTYFTSLVICTITALIILSTDYTSAINNSMNGIEIVSYALNEHFGIIGIYLLTTIIFLFAFSTILTSYYYGELNLKYLLNSKNLNTYLKIAVIINIIYSSYIRPDIIWSIVDIFVAFITIINVYALIKLKKSIKQSK